MSEEEAISELEGYMLNHSNFHEDFKEAIDTILDLYKQEKEKNKNCINPDKARISYFDTKKGMQVVIEGFIPKSKLKQILYPTPENPIDLEIQNSKMYEDLLKLIGE